MKIVYASSSELPSRSANSIHVMRMCDAMSDNGHSVTLLAKRGAGDRKSNEALHRHYGTRNAFEIDFYRPIGSVQSRAHNALQVLMNFLSIAILLSRAKPDIVYGRDVFGCHVALTLGYRVVFETHRAFAVESRLSHWIVKRVCDSPLVQRVVTISDKLASLVTDGNPAVPGNKVLVAHDGSDDFPTDRLPEKDLRDGAKLLVGYIGSFYKGRGIEFILEMARQCDDFRFVLVGAGDSDIERLRPETPENVEIVGFVPPSEANTYLNACDVLLAPYQKRVAVAGGRGDTSAYMSPLKIFEYMASGNAIVASDLPVLHEVLEDRKTCLLVSPDNLSAWCEALNTLSDDLPLRRNLGATARDQFLRRHTWTQRAKLVIDKLPGTKG